jgi:hypothetical protein
LIQADPETRLFACCPHCGLFVIAQFPNFHSGMATDFLFGNKINFQQATYLLDSSVTLCCAPSVLTFTRHKDAISFKKGFGGDILNFEQALVKIRDLMSVKVKTTK